MKPRRPTTSPGPGDDSFVKRSSLYQEFLAEREEILRHKWIESEKVGYDIGFDRALVDWVRNHRDKWRESRRPRPAGEAADSAGPQAASA